MTLAQPLLAADTANLPKKAPNRLSALLLKWIFRAATVTEVQVLSEHFRLITLAGEALKQVAWIPGQKVQITFGGSVMRTYTPIEWDAAAGVTRLLFYLHGAGPSSEWTTSLNIGDECLFFGPRASLDLSHLARPALIFGDETSFGLAHAVQAAGGLSQVALLFEVASLPESQAALQALGITGATLVQRSAQAAHLAEVEAALLRTLEAPAATQVVLTGQAASIVRLRQALRTRGLAAAQLKVKAYWAVGKSGLD